MGATAAVTEERQGLVLECAGHRVRVRIEPDAGCPRCAAGEGCGQGLLGVMRGEPRPVTLWVTVPEGSEVAPGDCVMLTVPPSALVAGAALVYLAPLAGLVLGAVVADTLVPGPEALTVAAGLAGLAGGLIIARGWLNRPGRPGRFEPVFLRTVPVSEVQIT
ncbi:MAG: SoxR reducing system RseC family protein [Pseudomonadota bacterium]